MPRFPSLAARGGGDAPSVRGGPCSASLWGACLFIGPACWLQSLFLHRLLNMSSAALAPRKARSAKRVLPGFGLTLGYTIFYLSIIVLIPLVALLFKSFSLTWEQFWTAVSAPAVVASYELSFTMSFIAACVNVVFGMLIAWVLVRYQFPGKKGGGCAGRSAVCAAYGREAGISLSALYAGNGWIGQYFESLGIQMAYNPKGIAIALFYRSAFCGAYRSAGA